MTESLLRIVGAPGSPYSRKLRALFGEVGCVYAPFLLANAEAIARGAEQVKC